MSEGMEKEWHVVVENGAGEVRELWTDDDREAWRFVWDNAEAGRIRMRRRGQGALEGGD
jgi:hypothetical protein